MSSSSLLPTYLSLSRNINDFGRFADGGSDANWYVGYNNAWVVKLPPAPQGDFARAFIGAKLGRAKSRPNPKKPWLREPVDGKIYISISPRPAFSTAQSFFLIEASDIPLEPDPQAYVDGSGASDWFWAEIPVSLVNFGGPNYLAAWSPTKYFVRASSAPILAAAELEPSAAREAAAWNTRSVSGVPPRHPQASLETVINNIGPALAIKLIPPNDNEVVVSDLEAAASGKKVVAQFSVGGESPSEAWVEASVDQLDWLRVSRVRRAPPLVFTVLAERLPPGASFLRGAARDAFGNLGHGAATSLPYAAR